MHTYVDLKLSISNKMEKSNHSFCMKILFVNCGAIENNFELVFRIKL